MAWTIGLLAAPSRFHYPIMLYMLPLVVFFGFRAILGPLLYWRRVRCSMLEILGAALAGMGLSHSVGQGVFAGLALREGVFEITGKGAAGASVKKKAASAAFGGAREEALLFAGLLACFAAVAFTRQPNHLESALWLGVLGLQAFPYASALLCAALSRLPEAPEPAAVPAAAPARTAAPRLQPATVAGEAWRGGVAMQRAALPPSTGR
jgi:hypothetical protein